MMDEEGMIVNSSYCSNYRQRNIPKFPITPGRILYSSIIHPLKNCLLQTLMMSKFKCKGD
jgi:hypothetical protein